MTDGWFFEEDEDVEDIRKAWDQGERGVTTPFTLVRSSGDFSGNDETASSSELVGHVTEREVGHQLIADQVEHAPRGLVGDA